VKADLGTHNLDPANLEAAITARTKAILPGVVTPYVAPGVEHVYHLYVIQVPNSG